MKEDDRRLAEKISTPGKIVDTKLRQLLVERLSDTYKVVLRRSLRNLRPDAPLGLYCEKCDRWGSIGNRFPQEWTCRGCSRRFRIEFAVYEEFIRENDSDKT